MTDLMCEYRTYTDVSYSHKHSFAQLILPCEGSLHICTDIHDVLLDSDQLFFIPPESTHTFCSGGTNRFLVLDIPRAAFPECQLPLLNREIVGSFDEMWQDLRQLLDGEICRNRHNRNRVSDLVRQASFLLARNLVPTSAGYIHDHFNESIRLDKLASMEHYNPGYYCEWFQKRTGVTPGAYNQRIRLDHARHLLINTDLPVVQIAGLVGYEHQSSFTRMFKRLEGIPPHAYRKRWRNKT